MLSSTNYPTLLRTLRVGRSVPVMIRPASEVYTRKNEPKGHIRSAVNSDCLCRTCQERTPRLARRSPSTSPTLFAQIAKSNPPQDALQAWPETGVQPPTHPHVCGGTRGVEPTNHVRMGIRGNMQGVQAGGESRGRDLQARAGGCSRTSGIAAWRITCIRTRRTRCSRCSVPARCEHQQKEPIRSARRRRHVVNPERLAMGRL